MAIKLFDYQLAALGKMKTGCVLCGGVGSGKSLTSLAYYYLQNGGDIESLSGREYTTMCENPKDLYIITTAKKRDSLEWEGEMIPFFLSTHEDQGLYHNKVVVDSWNNISKYRAVQNSFFIFDEQRVVGKGQWVQSFLKIAKKNDWILLSATPGDTWEDYVPLFLANGFFKNRTQFNNEHVVFARFSKFPKVDRYLGETRLNRLRASILVQMDFKRHTISHHEDVYVPYDIAKYRELVRNRWNPWEERPIETASELCYSLRRIVNTDQQRLMTVWDIIHEHPKVIIFYNFDYELNLLKDCCKDYEIAEWNGHKHQPIPTGDMWIYLVQYTAGAEGWNCITTDTIIFFSQNYSYKIMAQSSGRIDRLNTPYKDLYYYHLKSRSTIDLAISKAVSDKKKFNETSFIKKRGY